METRQGARETSRMGGRTTSNRHFPDWAFFGSRRERERIDVGTTSDRRGNVLGSRKEQILGTAWLKNASELD